MKWSVIYDGIRRLIRQSGCTILLISGLNFSVYSQTGIRSELKEHEKSFNEELFITTDRYLYATGEKVWFKIYKFDGLTHTPSDIDGVAYLDILDPDNNPVDQLKIEMKGSAG